jgi:hypothetical protein
VVFKSSIDQSGLQKTKGSFRMKIKCLRFECEICSKLASIQVFYNKSGTIKYARARHYTGILNGKPQFGYHQQALEYIQRKLSEMPMDKTDIGHIGQNGQSVNVDLKKPELKSKLSTVAGGEGFEPSTPNLGGVCSLGVTALFSLKELILTLF